MKAMAIVGFLVLIAAPAAAAPEDVANDVADEVMSPYCDGVTLHDCPSAAASELRVEIEEWARRGWSKARIVAELEDRFGERIHATPQNSEGTAAWLLPLMAVLAGTALVGVLVARWVGSSRPENDDPIEPAYHAAVERELAALREEPH